MRNGFVAARAFGDMEGHVDVELVAQLEEFSPVWWARGCHSQTILGHATNRCPAPEGERRHTIELDDGDKLVAVENRPPGQSKVEGVALLMHGLGGDAEGRYMLSATRRFVEHGWAVFRLNQRGAGAGAGLATRLYNSGLSGDVARVVEFINELFGETLLVAVGYSMSGNMLLKYLGEQGEKAARCLAGAIAVNPPVKLATAIASTAKLRNYVYQHRFVRLLHSQLAANARDNDAAVHPRSSRAKTISDFDADVTVPSWGFADPEDYYARESAAPHLKSISVPTLVITADDDPFVPVEQFESSSWSDTVTVHITRGGGHMGYLSKTRTPFGDRRWLDHAVLTASRWFVLT